MKLEKPYLLFIGDAPDELAAKTAFGVMEWCQNDCIGQYRLPECVPDLEIPSLTMQQAVDSGAKTVLIGVANRGGVIPKSWTLPLVEALNAGMSIANGLHTPLDSVPEICKAAKSSSGNLIEIRQHSGESHIATGEKRTGRRLLTVGTDCSVGKMYTALSIAKEMQRRGMNADFRATGQTGIFIAGEGVSVDAVIADFMSGSIECLCPPAESDHWDIIEGQGSLHHPSFAGVSLGLLHGAQPDSLVLCHEPTRTHMRGLPDRPMPTIQEVMNLNLQSVKVVSDDAQFVGISVNTKHLSESNARSYIQSLEDEFDMPCIDPIVTGAGTIVDRFSQ